MQEIFTTRELLDPFGIRRTEHAASPFRVVLEADHLAQLASQQAELERLRGACIAFCITMAYTPSTIPGAIEHDLNRAYELARAALNPPAAESEGKHEK